MTARKKSVSITRICIAKDEGKWNLACEGDDGAGWHLAEIVGSRSLSAIADYSEQRHAYWYAAGELEMEIQGIIEALTSERLGHSRFCDIGLMCSDGRVLGVGAKILADSIHPRSEATIESTRTDRAVPDSVPDRNFRR